MTGPDDSLYGYSGVSGDNSVFRRGLVLGLTLAEISILVIFILLLAFGAALAQREGRVRELERELPRERASAKLLKVLGPPNDQDVQDLARKLVNGAVRAEELAETKGQLEKAREQVTEIEGALARSGVNRRGDGTGESIGKEVIKLAAREAAATKALGDLTGKTPGGMAKTVSDLRLENEMLGGSLKSTVDKLGRLTNGTLKPSCWQTPEGRSEYIFDVLMYQQTLVVHDRRLAHRTREEGLLTLPAGGFDRPLLGAAFQAAFLPVFEWGEARSCRFFVRVRDLTADKEGYKRMLISLESRFYRLEVGRF